ncbi:MAG: cupredoxin domain-containing protein [Hoeflea sp.]|uniref:cupredoxin domain-containing protein n=1 Tax=Hoeflea sp. TaxID=1940281 RepID=UPI003EF6DE01
MSRMTRRQFSGALAAGCAGLLSGVRGGRAAPTIHQVEIKGFHFKPERLVIKADDTVKWVNHDIAPHTATADDKSWDTKTLRKNKSGSITFAGAGTQTYHCKFHRKMIGEIIIE